jgi:HJR/Mrr/RecB family endonuclease
MKSKKTRYNKRMKFKTKKFLIKTALLSSLPMAVVYHFTQSFDYYPLVFVASFFFLLLPKTTLFVAFFSGVSLVAKSKFQSMDIPSEWTLPLALGLGVVASIGAILVFRKLFSSKFKLNKKTPIMDQIDNIKAGKSSHERGLAFEEFVCDVLKKMGMKAHTTTQLRERGKLPPSIQKSSGSGEQGVDIVAFDKGEKIAIQCKLYSSKVSNSAVQEISASLRLYGADRGVVITNQTFTSSAESLARANNIELIDRFSLEDMVKKVA